MLNVYLFEYLPEWYDKHGGKYPSRPDDLNGWFMCRANAASHEPMPLKSFCEAMASHRKDNGYSILVDIKNFFEWIVAHSASYPGFENFRNYLNSSILPVSNRPSETNKRPFSSPVYVISLVYINKIFELLRLVNSNIFSGRINLADFELSVLSANSLGWDNKFKANGNDFLISEIPSRLFRRWRIPVKGVGALDIYSPHMIVHIFAALDTGLRHQGIQWLDCDFDKAVREGDLSTGAEVIEVAVDKVKTRRFNVIASWPLIEALRYQREIRDMVDSPQFDKVIPYEGNKNSKWGSLKPLFSYNLKTGWPYSDGFYNRSYRDFLVYLQALLRTAGVVCKFFELKPVGVSFGEGFSSDSVFVRRGVYGDYCPVVIATDMSPHHSRASVVKTWRKLISDRSVSLLKTGQELSTLRYYDRIIDEERNQIRNDVSKVLSRMYGGDRIAANLPTSAFRRAIDSNPADAMAVFKCLSLSIVDVEVEMDGVERIRRNRHAGLAHYSTHICVMNGICPSEIVSYGVANCCGICPYAVKGVDHLEAIEVKIYVMDEELADLHNYADELDGVEGAEAELERIDQRLSLVACEATAWRHSRDSLLSILEYEGVSSSPLMSYSPEVAGRAINSCMMKDDSVEYLLARLCQLERFPGLQNDAVRAKFKKLHAELMNGKKRGILKASIEIGDDAFSGVSSLMRWIRSAMTYGGISIEQLAENIRSVTGRDYHAIELLGADA